MLTKLNTEMQINPGCTNGSIMRANMKLAASVYDSRFFQLPREAFEKTCEYEQAEKV